MGKTVGVTGAGLTVVGVLVVSLAFPGASAVAAPGANLIDALTTTADADAGNGWAIDPANPGGGGVEQLVEGPATPPSGRGSLQLTTPSIADRAQVYTNPAGAAASGWGSLAGATFSTFTFATSNVGSNLPVMRFAGWQVGTTAFTTVSFGQPGNGTAVTGQWQTWTLSDDSIVSQSNASDAGFCVQASPCTFAEFVARYPTGLWGQVLIGLGSGAAAGASGFADAVSVTHGTAAYSFDFEVPTSQNSTASVQQGPASSTGGQAIVTLTASPVAAGPVTFTITATLPDGSTQSTEQTVAVGGTLTATVAVPFGTTGVSVTAESVVIATGTVTFEAPELAATGGVLSPPWVPVGALLAGAVLLMVSASRRRRRGARD
jgi:hypothetical protein